MAMSVAGMYESSRRQGRRRRRTETTEALDISDRMATRISYPTSIVNEFATWIWAFIARCSSYNGLRLLVPGAVVGEGSNKIPRPRIGVLVLPSLRLMSTLTPILILAKASSSMLPPAAVPPPLPAVVVIFIGSTPRTRSVGRQSALTSCVFGGRDRLSLGRFSHSRDSFKGSSVLT